MPKNFPEIWEPRVKQNLEKGGVAPFLDGISELTGDVTQLGEQNLIHVPTTSFNPEVLINNATYPLALQDYTDAEAVISLDKYQTKPTPVSDDMVIGASYDVIDAVTKGHVSAINVSKYKKAIHAIAPASHAADTPVLSVKDAGGVFKYEDLVALKNACDEAKWPEAGRRLVLSGKHYNDLLLDRERFGDQLVNYKAGALAPVIVGFEIYSYTANPSYDAAKAKKPYGAVAAAGDKVASVAFLAGNIAKKTGLTKQYFSEAKNDPKNQTNLLNYRHYYIALPAENKYIAAII